MIERGCCGASGLPWFHKTLPSPTSDYIELRLCCTEGTVEDVPVGMKMFLWAFTRFTQNKQLMCMLQTDLQPLTRFNTVKISSLYIREAW